MYYNSMYSDECASNTEESCTSNYVGTSHSCSNYLGQYDSIQYTYCCESIHCQAVCF